MASMAIPDQGAALPQSANGLSSREAAERLARVGPNQLKPSQHKAAVLQFLL